jgi:hypothetical protein
VRRSGDGFRRKHSRRDEPAVEIADCARDDGGQRRAVKRKGIRIELPVCLRLSGRSVAPLRRHHRFRLSAILDHGWRLEAKQCRQHPNDFLKMWRSSEPSLTYAHLLHHRVRRSRSQAAGSPCRSLAEQERTYRSVVRMMSVNRPSFACRPSVDPEGTPATRARSTLRETHHLRRRSGRDHSPPIPLTALRGTRTGVRLPVCP